MDPDELWVDSYQGEVLGEALFGLLAERETDPGRRRYLEALTLLERATRQLAEPVFERHDLDRGDSAASVTMAGELADGVATLSWEEFLGSFEPVISQFLEKYRRLVTLAADEDDRRVAEAYVAHELALAASVRRELGQEAGDPLEPIFDLAHVAAAAAA
jgi:hypothetical protein